MYIISRLLFLFLFICVFQTHPAYGCYSKGFTEATVVEVRKPGILLLSDGREVRFANLLLPYPPPGLSQIAEWSALDDVVRTIKHLFFGKTIYLVFGKYHKDRYGRLVAQVYYKQEGKLIWGQEQLVVSGRARVYSFGGHFICYSQLLKFENTARKQRIGIWKNDIYRVFDATHFEHLLLFVNQFQIVEGVVKAVALKRGNIYLNFGINWREDFTVKVRRKFWKKFEKAGFVPEFYRGKYLRVRGWIKDRNGPLIQVQHPSQIEVISYSEIKTTP